MTTLPQCAAYGDLSFEEIMVCAVPSGRHVSLLASYLLNMARGESAVRNMIQKDIHGFMDLGAQERAADALLVLRLFLSRYPEAPANPLHS
jgi:hypothetical protein